MDSLLSTVNGTFITTPWDFWKALGLTGNLVFGSRFFVQWWVTERQKRVVVPTAFWWLSLIGSGLLLLYGVHRGDLVFIIAYAFNWIPYVRSLMISSRVKRAEVACAECGTFSPGPAKFCAQCGARVDLLRGEQSCS